jgi:hypothetical protein
MTQFSKFNSNKFESKIIYKTRIPYTHKKNLIKHKKFIYIS